MYSKIALFTVCASVLGAMADAASHPDISQCKVDSTFFCCKQVLDAKSSEAQDALRKAGADVKSVTGQVGVTCNILNLTDEFNLDCGEDQLACCDGTFLDDGVAVTGCKAVKNTA